MKLKKNLRRFIKRLLDFFRNLIKARINKISRMRGHPTTQGNLSKSIYVNTPLLRGLFRVYQLESRVDTMPDKLRSEAFSLGRFYKGRDGFEHIRVTTRFHGRRYWFISQLVRNYARAQGAPTGAGLRMLEIGCNTGLLSIQAKTECPDLDVTALDILEKYVQLGQILEKALGAAGVRWIVGDGARLNEQFKGETFDLVFLCEILEHFEFSREQEELLNQAVSICSPGGKVMVSVPFEDSILMAGHLTTFDAMMLTNLVQPFAREIMWFAEERVRYNLDKHFFLMFTPKKRGDGI